MNREETVERIIAIREDLKNTAKGTPHWKDTRKHLRRLEKQLMIYDNYRKEFERSGKNNKIHKLYQSVE